MNLLVTAPAYYPDPSVLPMVRSAKHFGIPLQTYGDGSQSYPGWITSHIDDLRKFLEARAGEYDTVLFSDAADAFFCCPLDRIVVSLMTMWLSRPPTDFLVLSAESDCYPNADLARHFPDTGTPWRYPNGGGFVATMARAIRALTLLQSCLSGNPQLRWHQACAEGNLKYKIDSRCDIFQTMSGQGDNVVMYAGKPHNPITGSYPCILHFNGTHDWEPWYQKVIG